MQQCCGKDENEWYIIVGSFSMKEGKTVRKKMGVTACFLFLLLAASILFCQEGIVETQATGFGDIVNQQLELAREKALEDALRRAVEQAAGALISSSTLMENGTILEDRIYKGARGFVQSFEISKEGPQIFQVGPNETQSLYMVEIQARVVQTFLEQSLQQIIAEIGGIRTLVSLEGNEVFRSGVISMLLESGIDVLDPQAMQDLQDRNKAVMVRNSEEEACAAGLWFFCRFVLRGRCEESVEERVVREVPLVVAGVSFTMDLLDVTQGRVVQSFSVMESMTAGSSFFALEKALEKALGSLGEKEIPQVILSYLPKALEVDLVAIGIPEMGETLAQIPGLSGLQPGETIASQRRFHFRYQGTIPVLVLRLEEFGLHVQAVGNTLTCSPWLVEVRLEGVTFQQFSELCSLWEVEGEYSSSGSVFFLARKAREISEDLVDRGFSILEYDSGKVLARK